MRHFVLILVAGLAATAGAQTPTPAPSTATWGVMFGGRRVDNSFSQGPERYTALVYQRSIAGSRHGIRLEVVRDAQSREWSFGPTCANCYQSSAFEGTSYGAMVSWVYERRLGKRVRPYMYYGVGAFSGQSSYRLRECPVSSCDIGALQQDDDRQGWGVGLAGGAGVTVEWKRVLLSVEYRGSSISGNGSSGANGFVVGVRMR